MRILLIGSGTIGGCIYERLSSTHEVLRASRSGDELKVDIESLPSIVQMYREAGTFDAVICAAGHAHFGPFGLLKEEDVYKGIRSKMMGQINLVLAGKDLINDAGSFTLTSGILADEPVRHAACLSLVNGGINSFVMAAAVELSRGIRINAVAAGLVEDAVDTLGSAFPGHSPVPMYKVADAYQKCVEGVIQGKVIRVYE